VFEYAFENKIKWFCQFIKLPIKKGLILKFCLFLTK
jgi:hypothetical protein